MNTEQAFIYEMMQNIHRYTPPSNAEGELMGNNSRFNYGPLKDNYVFKNNFAKENPLENKVKIGYDMSRTAMVLDHAQKSRISDMPMKDMYKPAVKPGKSVIDSILYSIN